MTRINNFRKIQDGLKPPHREAHNAQALGGSPHFNKVAPLVGDRLALDCRLVAAEALTEPRGGSDFFGAMTRAELKEDHFVLNGMKRFVENFQTI